MSKNKQQWTQQRILLIKNLGNLVALTQSSNWCTDPAVVQAVKSNIQALGRWDLETGEKSFIAFLEYLAIQEKIKNGKD